MEWRLPHPPGTFHLLRLPHVRFRLPDDFVQQAAVDPVVKVMKNKSRSSKWAMALCALAVFSFTAQAANASVGIVGGDSGTTVEPAPADTNHPRTIGIGPLPPAPTSSETVANGTFTGTLMLD